MAEEIGFSKAMLWYGSFGSGAGVKSSSVLQMATRWIGDERIVIDHANSMATPYVFDQILGLIKSRHLKTVTLQDVWPKTL